MMSCKSIKKYNLFGYNINVLSNPYFNYNLHFKRIKRIALNNVIDFNFLSCISNAYLYIWQCSYNQLIE